MSFQFPESYLEQIDPAVAIGHAEEYMKIPDAAKGRIFQTDFASNNTALNGILGPRVELARSFGVNQMPYLEGFTFGMYLLDKTGCGVVFTHEHGEAHSRSYADLYRHYDGDFVAVGEAINAYVEEKNPGYYAGAKAASAVNDQRKSVIIASSHVYLAMNSAAEAEAMKEIFGD